MCFIIEGVPEKLIAEEDIVCYKALERRNSLRGDVYCSVYTLHWYPLGLRHSPVPLGLERRNKADIVTSGYHSFICRIDAAELAHAFSDDSDTVVGECIIPKGSEYYKNSEEYVSSSIILKEIMEVT